MNYNIYEIKEMAEKLHLLDVVDIYQCAIEGMNKIGDNLNVFVLTTHNTVAKAFIKEILHLPVSGARVAPCEIDIEDESRVLYTIDNEFGKLNVDEKVFVSLLLGKNEAMVHASIKGGIACCKNLNIKFMYIDGFNELSNNEWIMRLASFDKFYYLLDGLQVFNDNEKKFSREIIDRLFSNPRKAFVIGNAQFLNTQEQKEVFDYVKSICQSNVLMSVDDENSLGGMLEDISGLSANAIELRGILEPDVANFAKVTLMGKLPDLKKELSNKGSDLDEAIALLTQNSEMIQGCEKNAINKIDSFIKDYAFLQFEKKVIGFNNALCESLEKEISMSKDIDSESKCINKYLEFVWNRFISDQEAWVKSVVLKEISDIETMVNNDVNILVGKMDVQAQRIIKDYIQTKYQVHSYIIGKEGKTDVEDLSKTMKIGSIVLVLFAPVAALLTFGGSELVKVMFKGKVVEGKKDQLIMSSQKMSKQMVEQLLQQVHSQFYSIAGKLKEQTKGVYESITAELSGVLLSKQRSATETEEMLSIIDNFEQTIKN